MSKMSELAAALEELKRTGNALIDLSETLTKLFSGSDEAPVTEKAPQPVKEITFVDVRKLLTEKSRSGKTEEVKALLKKYGADRLSDIKPENYAALIAEAEGM